MLKLLGWLVGVVALGSATSYALEGGDFVGALVQIADGVGEGFVALTLGFAARPAALGFLVGGILLLALGSFTPVSFEVESLTVVSRLANRDWRRMSQIILLAGVLGLILGAAGVYTHIVDFVEGTVLAGMLTGVGVILCLVAYDLFRQNMVVGGVSVIVAIVTFLPLADNTNGLVYALGASVGAALVAAFLQSRVRPVEPLEVDLSKERIRLIPLDRFRFLTNAIVIRGALALLALRVGTSIAYSTINGDIAGAPEEVDPDETNIIAGASGAVSALFGGPPLEPIISGTAPAPNPITAGALMMFLMAAILVFGLLPRLATQIPVSTISGFLFLLGAFAAFSGNVGGVVSDENPYAGPVTVVVTAATFDPFLGMVAGVIVRALTGWLLPT
ncbi:MAG: NCS2 family permease [Actinomycetota bacterium]|nr:NCS2 family permease [Actinomycetota bacterium]